jgi:NADH-quinone oxidoreductase subunit J
LLVEKLVEPKKSTIINLQSKIRSAMTIDLILFLVLALVSVVSAVAMLVSKNAVYAALYLILNFSVIAVIYLLLGAPFIAMAQITVYAGAIMVLFLFVIMLLGTEQLRPTARMKWQQPLAIFLTVVLIAEMAYLLFFHTTGLPAILPAATDPAASTFGGPAAIGRVLFSEYLLPFEATSILLLVAMIGAIVLTQVEKKRKA